MSFSMSCASLPAYEIALKALSDVLDKGDAFASAKKIDPSVLLQTRLAPDMFPLVRQVQIATDLAKNGMARLAGAEAPRYEDSETTIAQLKTRIKNTISFLKTLDTSAIDDSIDRNIVFPMGSDKKGEMKGLEYLIYFVTPNVYFHIVAAYSILRTCGVEIGKTNFLGAIPIKMS